MTTPSLSPWSIPVLVAALGYFVDIYDIVIFGVVRGPSLDALGLGGVSVQLGQAILSGQMLGMLLGGVLWGVLGDKIGRLPAMWGSIVLYSLANLACAGLGLVEIPGISVAEQYWWLRFIAGVGLAGELGVAITLISELVDRTRRGWATTMIAGVGVSGAVAAVALAKLTDWRTAYIVGGVLGFGLLFLRVRVLESELFARSRATEQRRGDLGLLLATRSRWRRLLACVLIGVPTWFAVGVLVMFIDRLAIAKDASVQVDKALAILWCYIGLIAGDLGSGALSQWWRSRRRVLVLCLLLTAACIVSITLLPLSTNGYYALITLLGVSIGYWAVFVSVAAEQFGTNLRSTVATLVPNVARGSYAVLSMMVGGLAATQMSWPIASLTVGLGCVALALLGVLLLKETWGCDLDWDEV